jgi:hypothetical protein
VEEWPEALICNRRVKDALLGIDGGGAHIDFQRVA